MIFKVKYLHSNMTRPINTSLQINSETVINGWVQLLQGNVYQFVGNGRPYGFEFIIPSPGEFVCIAQCGIRVTLQMMKEIYEKISVSN